MLIVGRNTVLEALKSSYKVGCVYMLESIGKDKKIDSILDIAKQKKVTVKLVDKNTLFKLAKTADHQNMVAEVDYSAKDIAKIDWNKGGAYIYIREAQDVHNIGAIIRTAEVLGLNGIIIPQDREITATVAKVSTGAIFYIPVFTASLFPTIKLFHKNAYNVYAIERGSKKNLKDIAINLDCLFIIGGEDHGLSEEIINQCDDVLTIPQKGNVNSLNMSVASSIVMYEYLRQNTEIV